MSNPTELLVLIGIPASGKSTFANKFVNENKNWIKVSRDDIRMSFFQREVDPNIEPMVSTIQDNLIRDSLRKGINVVVDNCNVKESYRNDLFKIAESVGNVLYKEMVFSTSLEECLKRNKERTRKVPEDVIVKFAKVGRDILWGNKKPKTVFIPEFDLNEKNISDKEFWSKAENKAIIVDLDGTISLLNGRNPYDASKCDKDLPSIPVIEAVSSFKDRGYKIIFVSGREDKYRDPTVAFLKMHLGDSFFEDCLLFMRKSGDMRADTIIKKEIYINNIVGEYNVLAAIDDRPQVVRMWRRDLNLFVFQVNDREF